jgi:protein MpaA
MSYQGETLDPAVHIEAVIKNAKTRDFQVIELAQAGRLPVVALQRSCSRTDAPRIYLSTGVHGDEPGGPSALLEALRSDLFSRQIDWTIIPMLNPTGFAGNTRENSAGIDLNRDFRDSKSSEVNALINWVYRQTPWDMALLLHEDWESIGFYLYSIHSKNDPSLVRSILDATASHCPIDLSNEIDGMPAIAGVIQTDPDHSRNDPKLEGKWPEAFFLHYNHLAVQQLTTETPSCFPLETRIAANVAIIEAVSDYFEKRQASPLR